MQVPSGAPTSRTDAITPALTLISVPDCRPRARVRSVKCETEAMLGSASPRKPSVSMAPRSAACAILLVAWRSIASRASSGSMPWPSSSTRISFLPPSSTAMTMRRAPASSAFSTSSLTTEAGRSTTSPAAIWLARSGGSRWILPTIYPVFPTEEGHHHDNHGDTDAAQPPELGRLSARKLRQHDIHAPQSRQQMQRHEDDRNDREHFHDLVQAIAHIRQMRVQNPRDPIMENHAA